MLVLCLFENIKIKQKADMEWEKSVSFFIDINFTLAMNPNILHEIPKKDNFFMRTFDLIIMRLFYQTNNGCISMEKIS